LLHPEDSPWSGTWSRERWDLVAGILFGTRQVRLDPCAL